MHSQNSLSCSRSCIYKNILIYNFWFFDAARTAVLLKNRLTKKNRVKSYSRAHRYDLYAEENSLNYLPLTEWLIKNTDYIFPCSENGREYLLKDFSKYENKIKLSFLGTVDYGIQKYTKCIPTFISCSRLVEVKRVDRIIDSLRLLDNAGAKLKWIHFGGGMLLDNLKQKAQGFKNIEIEFFGNVKNSELLKIYSENYYKGFINVSGSEGLPISIMEATSFGMPVIATDVGGTSEIIKDSKNGFLLMKTFKDEELANLILHILNLPSEEYQRLRKSARKIWEERFEYKTNFKKLFDNFENQIFY